jgi:hypothetical protein
MVTNAMANQSNDFNSSNNDEEVSPVSVVEDLVTPRPIGRKKAKRLQEEEKIMDNVAEKLKGLAGSSNTGPLLATALSKFADIFSEGLREWKDQQMFTSAAPELRQRYENLRLLSRIEELETGLAIRNKNYRNSLNHALRNDPNGLQHAMNNNNNNNCELGMEELETGLAIHNNNNCDELYHAMNNACDGLLHLPMNTNNNNNSEANMGGNAVAVAEDDEQYLV